jgi:hypothetical protein
MESVYADYGKMIFLVVMMTWGWGCSHKGVESRSSRVPESLQLPAIDPLPGPLNSREHPILQWLAGQLKTEEIHVEEGQ